MADIPAGDAEELIHITLIHGTFAPRSKWTQEGSALRIKLQATLGPHVRFHEFTWSSLPSHLARQKASRQLQAFLAEIFRTEPAGKHFIVAHSHGGMVALYALRDWPLANKIDGLITLSTPFLLARLRYLNAFGKAALVTSFLALLWLLPRILMHPFQPYLSTSGGVLEHPWYVVGPIFIVGMFLSIFSLLLVSGLFFGVIKLADWFYSTLKLPSIQPDRLLVIRGPSDEASAIITTFHTLEMLVTSFWGRQGQIDHLVESGFNKLVSYYQTSAMSKLRSFIIAWSILGLPFVAALIVGILVMLLALPKTSFEFANGLLRELLTPWPFIAVVAIGMITLPFIVAGLAAAIVGTVTLTLGFLSLPPLAILIFCMALLVLPTIPELGPCVLFIIVSAEWAPPGEFTGLQLTEDGISPGAFLLHSTTYAHPDALNKIAAWLVAPKLDRPLIIPAETAEALPGIQSYDAWKLTRGQGSGRRRRV